MVNESLRESSEHAKLVFELSVAQNTAHNKAKAMYVCNCLYEDVVCVLVCDALWMLSIYQRFSLRKDFSSV